MSKIDLKLWNFRIRRILIVALIAPLFTAVTAVSPQTAFATPPAASDGSCTQVVGNSTGITVTRSSNDCIVTFKNITSTTWRAPAGVTSVRYLVVGGGASGDRGVCGVYWGHGGGGGQVQLGNLSVTPDTLYNVAVGTGGLGSPAGVCSSTQVTTGNNGTQSVFGSVTSAGGLRAPNNSVVGGASGAGFAGGTGTGVFPAGGGGGAGGVGTDINGGVGVNSDITGETFMYGSGGAGRNDLTSTTESKGPGTAPSGGGTAAVAPLANRGGGGADISPGWHGGANGVVVIRYTELYTVTFNANGAVSGSASSTTLLQSSRGAAITLASQGTLANGSMRFIGWNTQANGQGTRLVAGASYTPTSDVILYAQYSRPLVFPTIDPLKLNPYMRFLASNYNASSKVWVDSSGNNRNASVVRGSPSVVTTSVGNGNSKAFSVLSGGTTEGIQFGNSPFSNSTHTLFTVARYSGSTKARIFDGVGGNYLHGFHGGQSGVAHHNGWVTSEVDRHGSNWVLGTSFAFNYRSNGISRGTSGGTADLGPLSINHGVYRDSQASNFEVAEVLIFDYQLNPTQIAQVESYLSQTYGVDLTPPATYPTSQTLVLAAGVGGRSETLTAADGFGARTFTMSPPRTGFSIDTSTANGVALVVSPLVAIGTYIETLTVTDAAGFAVNHVVTVTVNQSTRFDTSTATIVVTTHRRGATLRLNTLFGVGTKVFTMTPAGTGITLDTSTAASGFATLRVDTFTAVGTYSQLITVTDDTRIRSTYTVNITINGPPTVSSTSAIATTPVTSGLQLNLDAGDPASYSGTGTAWSDISGKGKNATWQVSPTWDSATGGIFNLNGTSQYATTSNLGPLDVFSVETWVKFNSLNPFNASNTGKYPCLVSDNFLGGTGGVVNYSICFAGSNEIKGGYWRSDQSRWVYTPGFTPNVNTWYHFVYTVSKSGAIYTSTLFQNGNLVGSTPDAMIPGNSGSTMFIGKRWGTVADFPEYISGSIPIVRVYNRALSTTEVSQNYNAVLPRFTNNPTNRVTITTTESVTASSSIYYAGLGTGNKTFALSNPTAGLSIDTSTVNTVRLNAANTLTATSTTVARSISQVITATDSMGVAAATPVYVTTVINPRVIITASVPLTLTTTFGRVAYDTFTATQGTGTKTFTGVSSAFPSAFVVTNPSTNVGLLTVANNLPAGTYTETITATDSVGATTNYVLTVIVNPAPAVIGATANSVATTVGRSASLRINVTGGTSTRILTTTNVTAGITIDSSTITSNYVTLNVGTTLAANTYSFVITATDLVGATGRETFTVTVNALPTISTPSTTITTTQGVAATLSGSTSTGGTGNKVFTITGSNTGFSIDTTTANAYILTIASTVNATSATVVRTFTETVTATDSASAVVRQAYAVTINPPIRVESTTSVITTTSGILAWDTFTATQGTGAKTFAFSGTPNINGFTLTQANNQAVLRVGQTVNPGTYTLTITATDAVGAVTTLTKTVVVNVRPTISGNANMAGTTGYAFSSQSYSAVNGTGALTYSITVETSTAGRNTSGITLSATTGSPTINVSTIVLPDTYTVTLRATDSLAAFGTFLITLRINETATITGTRTLTKVYGEDLSQVFATSGGTGAFNVFASNICTSEKSTYSDSGVNYTVEKFNGTDSNNGSCNWFAPNNVTSATVLVVGGGGGGGSRHQGGGGGGGVMYATNYSLTPGNSYALSVGDGGAGATGGPFGGNGSTGQNSFFGGSSGTTSVVANGGGGSNANGGSGGGSNYQTAAAGTATPGSTIGTSRSAGSSTMTINGVVANVTAYGQSGAVGQGDGLCRPVNTSTARGWCGGGGGGALTPGTIPAVLSSPQWRAGNGGNGVELSITGSPLNYAGGGGGGAGSDTSPYATTAACLADSPREGFGGGGGGGNGSRCLNAAMPGTNGLGGGGGGGGYAYYGSGDTNAPAGKGGSGTVIVRYVTPAADTQSARITMDTLLLSPGVIRLNAPRLLPVNTYTQTIRVRDSAATPVVTTATVNLIVTKATPTLTLSLPGSVTTAKYGNPVTISAVATTPGTVAFVNGSSNITACSAVATTAGLATCSFTPTVIGATTLRATLTPTDTANFNSSAQESLTITVAKADTLTVTVTSLTRQFTGSTVAVTSAFTTTGLVAIDSLTAISMLYSGTANNGNAYSNTTAPTNAGTYSITPNFPASASAYTFAAGSLGTTSSLSNYESVTVVAGTLTINRAPQVMAFSYPNSNTATYSPTGTITASATTSLDSAARTYSSSTLTKCTIDSATAVISIVEAGSCQVSMAVAQTFNYLADTATATVTINKASRTFSLTPAVGTLKYADTTTVTATLSAGAADGTISYTLGSPAGCTFDPLSGELLAISGTVQCPLTATISEGINYLAETTTAMSLTIARANAPVITIDTITAMSHTPGVRALITPTFTVTGLKNLDTANSMTFTYSFVSNPFETFTYSNTQTPIDAATYRITPSALTLSAGLLSNYETPTYSSSAINFIINRIGQESVTIENTNGEVNVPFTMIARGGNTNGALSFTIVSGSTCSVSGNQLSASQAGACVVTVTMAGNKNYLSITSETITVRVRNFVTITIEVPSNPNTGITIIPSTPLTRGPDTCTTGCVPSITSISVFGATESQLVLITGLSFNGATKVFFRLDTTSPTSDVEATTFTVNSDTQISVLVPVGLVIGEFYTIRVATPEKTSARFYDIEILP